MTFDGNVLYPFISYLSQTGKFLCCGIAEIGITVLEKISSDWKKFVKESILLLDFDE